tara:strand:+ start:1779 stop:2714 length:936 start_codon:yes stop_codon:yes gene_type:complete
MKTTVRLAGAQIPISGDDVQYNKKEILKALDWAKENEVDFILTPECALSGYKTTWQERFEEIQDALKEIEDYQKKLEVGLHLGTMFKEPCAHGILNRNQIRHYDQQGQLISVTDKCYLISSEGGADANLVPSFKPCEPIKLPYAPITGVDREFIGVGLICNDIWSVIGASQDHTPNDPISNQLMNMSEDGLELIIHATNGVKYEPELLDLFYGDRGQDVVDTMSAFHDGSLRQTALKSHTSILTVDTPTSWRWNGEEEKITECMTSSESGFLDPLGKWQTNVPRFGRQYFYYDYNVKDAFKFKPKSLGVAI